MPHTKLPSLLKPDLPLIALYTRSVARTELQQDGFAAAFVHAVNLRSGERRGPHEKPVARFRVRGYRESPRSTRSGASPCSPGSLAVRGTRQWVRHAYSTSGYSWRAG